VLADTVVDGVPLPAGSTVSAASLGLHTHPSWWTNPHLFDPDRFAPDRAEDKVHSHLFVPFGGGAHLCIGNHLGELMAKIVVVRVLRRFHLAADPLDRVPFRPVPIPKPARPLLIDMHAHEGRRVPA
jgi:cytochrome P450